MKRWKCTVCGQIFEGDVPPVPCPVCGAGEDAFILLEETGVVRWRCTVCGQIFEGDVPPVPCPVCGAGESAFEKIIEKAAVYKNDTDDNFVLVGGGFASVEAAKAIRQRNTTASITIVMNEKHVPYNRPTLSDVVEDGLSFPNLVLEESDFYTEKNISLLTGVSVDSIDKARKILQLSTGETLPYSKLLLATGSNSFNPIESEDGSVPVCVLRTYDDAERLISLASDKRVVLVGGGILGLEAALALRERGSDVTVVEFAPRLLSLQADETVSALIHAQLEKLGIHVLTGCSVNKATPTGALLSNGTTIEADVILASMGVRSEVSLAKSLGIEVNRGILVDDFMHTSEPSIWAAGDCAEFNGNVLAIAGAASAMGATAGASMCGDEETPYSSFIPATMLEMTGLSIFSVGSVNSAVETVLYTNKQTGSYKRLFFAKKVLIGALFVGENPGAKAVTSVSNKVPLSQALSLLS